MVQCAMIVPHFGCMIPARTIERDDDMKRAYPRRPLLARTALARLTLLAPLMAFAGSSHAQSQAGTVTYTPVNPWSGITVIITPPAPEAATDSPYDTALQDNAAAPAADPVAPAEPETEELVGHVVSSTDVDQVAPKPSIWSTLFGAPAQPATEKPAPNTLLPARKVVTATQNDSLPTQLKILEGPASVAVSTSASTSAPVSSPLAKHGGGGSGEVKTRVGYEVNNLTLYGTGGLGAAESTGAVSVYDSMTVGSTYKVPLGLVKGDTLGATVEVNNAAALTTGVELRAPMGDYQRFISVQRSTSSDSSASDVVKAGVLGKF